jgi:hypothetical protein
MPIYSLLQAQHVSDESPMLTHTRMLLVCIKQATILLDKGCQYMRKH